MRVKICGLTRPGDVRAAVAAGADYLGLVFVPSPRALDPGRAARLAAAAAAAGFRGRLVGVFADADPAAVARAVRACGLGVAQLHGDEPPAAVARVAAVCEVWKAVRVRPGWAAAEVAAAAAAYPGATLLLDAFVPGVPGATGVGFDHALAAAVARARPVVLAGGLTPETVGAAVAAVRPAAVDVCSGVEAAPGEQDAARVRAFVEAARRAG